MYYTRKMVKNTTGGNKAKSKASKSFIKPANTYLRTAECEFELYAQVTRVLGNGMCHVLCVNDGQPGSVISAVSFGGAARVIIL